MTRHGTMRRLGVTVGIALICCVYAGVASAEESLLSGRGSEAVAETSESAVAETSEPARAVRKGKKSAEPAAETSEPVGTAPETSPEPAAETSEPVSDSGVVAPAEPTANIPDLIGSSLTPNSINVLRDVFSDLAAAASGDPRSAVRTDRRGGRDAPPANGDPSPLPGPAPQAPVPVGPAGASGAPGGGSSGGFIALVAFLLLASLPLSRVVELFLTRMRTPRLVADLARPD